MEASINAPHVNDDADQEDFFGDADEPVMEDGDAVAGEPTVEEAVGNTSTDMPTDLPTDAPTSAQPSAEATPETQAAGDGGDEPPAEPPAPPATSTPPDPDPASKPKANPERSYMVFREITLDAAALEKLRAHVKAGGEAPVVYSHVETVKSRNDQHALKQVYATHREEVGDKPRLVPVSERAWRPKTVQPRQKIEEALEIL